MSLRAVNVSLPVVVPDWANWLCVDPEGCVWAYQNKPQQNGLRWGLDPDNDNDYRRVMVAESVWWFVDVADPGPAWENWRQMLWPISPATMGDTARCADVERIDKAERVATGLVVELQVDAIASGSGEPDPSIASPGNVVLSEGIAAEQKGGDRA